MRGNIVVFQGFSSFNVFRGVFMGFSWGFRGLLRGFKGVFNGFGGFDPWFATKKSWLLGVVVVGFFADSTTVVPFLLKVFSNPTAPKPSS